MLCHRVSDSSCCGQMTGNIFRGEGVKEDLGEPPPPKVRELHYFKRSEYADPLTQHHFQEDLSPHNNNCGKLKSCIGAVSSLSSTVTSLMNMDASELVFCLS